MKKSISGKHIDKRRYKYNLILLGIILLICIVTIIINLKTDSIDSEIMAKEIINTSFNALKEVDKKEINRYIDYNQLVSSLDEMILNENEGEISNLEKEIFNSMEWEIKDIEVNDNKIVATVQMKNKDFKEILTKWIKRIVDEKEKNKVISNEFSLKALYEIIMQNNNTKIVTKNITLEKQNENWKIVVNNDLRDLIFTGIGSVATILNEEN